MNARERIMATLSLQEPDRVPVNARGVEPLNHLWSDGFERACVLREMGVDDLLWTRFHAWQYGEEVREEISREASGDSPHPMMISKYHTPAGTLTTHVQTTGDYDPPRLFLGADHLMPRTREYLIKDVDDLERLRFLLPDPENSDTSDFDADARRTVEFGEAEGFPTGVVLPSYSGFAMKNVGTVNLVTRAMDNDPLVEGILDLYLEWELKWVDYASGFGPDIIYHPGMYQGLDFWSPELFEKLFAGRNRAIADRIHEHGKKFLLSTPSTNVEALVDSLGSMDVDAFYCIDPTPPGCAPVDLKKMKAALGDKLSFWGGINALMTIARGTPDEVREAVRYAIDSLATRGGFILMPAGGVFFEGAAFGSEEQRYKGSPEDTTAYKNLHVFFEAALELGNVY